MTLRLGKPENRFDSWDKRISNVLHIAIAQTKILRDPVAGLVHVGIFWGFLVLLAAVGESIGEGFSAGFSLLFLGPIYNGIALSGDIMGAIVLCAVLAALFRRYVSGPDRVRKIAPASQLDATLILGTIALIMVSMFLENGARISLGAAGNHVPYWRPVSTATAILFSNGEGTRIMFELFWWLHIVLVLGLMNVLPYSKHFHVITSIPNVYFSNLGHDWALLHILSLARQRRRNNKNPSEAGLGRGGHSSA